MRTFSRLFTLAFFAFSVVSFAQNTPTPRQSKLGMGQEAAQKQAVKDSNSTEEPEDSTVYFKQGFYLSFEPAGGLDSLGERLETQLLWDRHNALLWSRTNSSLDGLVYGPTQFWNRPRLDGTYGFLFRRMPVAPAAFSASAPRTTLIYKSGLPRGQQFGFESMAPVEHNSQLYLSYLRTNAQGFYRNEGTDGHEMRLEAYGLDTAKREAWRVSVYLFNQESAQNGGLVDDSYFTENLPGIRSNIPVEYSTGKYAETDFRAKLQKRIPLATVATGMNVNQWSAENNQGQREYYYDTIAGTAALRDRYLAYEDTTRLVQLYVSTQFAKNVGAWQWNAEPVLGLEQYYSDRLGYDAFRTDSVNPGPSMPTQLGAYGVLQASLFRADTIGMGVSQLSADASLRYLGWNSTAATALLSWHWTSGRRQLAAKYAMQRSPQEYRWEELYGAAYDFRNTFGAFAHQEAELKAILGNRNRLTVALNAQDWTNQRALDSLKALRVWNGSMLRATLGGELVLGNWQFQLHTYGLLTTPEAMIYLPRWGSALHLAYIKRLNSNAEVEVGVQTRVESAYRLPHYAVQIPVYAAPNNGMAGVYPWVVPYISARLGTFQLSMRVLNTLQGVVPYSYFALQNVPMVDRYVQFSARWTLFN